MTEAVQDIDSAEPCQNGRSLWPLLAAWAPMALVFATLWYAYDATRYGASPYAYYVGWSCLMWAPAPLVLWFARRQPLRSHGWKWWLALHGIASILLSALLVLIEAASKWLRDTNGILLSGSLAHYFRQHLQLYLFTYWAVLAAAEFYGAHAHARERELAATRLETQLTAARLQALSAQLQPHFLFNTLQTAVTLVHEDPEGAEEVLLRLSSLLRASLSEFRTPEVPLRKELEFLDCYLVIQQRRFGERLQFELDVDERLLDLAVPSLVLQPLVENAIRHGVGTHRGNDLVTVNASQEADQLTLEVRNLRGRLIGEPQKALTRGVGLANTSARLQQLYGQQQSLTLLRLEPCGVCVRLRFPARAVRADSGTMSTGL
jgi:two-component system, LytTR family, sensor kinase